MKEENRVDRKDSLQKAFAPDELSMSIIQGLCDEIKEVVDDTPEGPRVRVCFQMKKENNE